MGARRVSGEAAVRGEVSAGVKVIGLEVLSLGAVACTGAVGLSSRPPKNRARLASTTTMLVNSARPMTI